MPEYLAAKQMTAFGETYERGDRVPLDTFPREKAEQLIEHRLVFPHRIEVTDAPSNGAPTVEVRAKDGGWYDVEVDGERANEKSLRYEEAAELKAEIESGAAAPA